MTKEDAHDFLDAARDGVDVSMAGIKEALIATGDLDEDGYFVHLHSPAGKWERTNAGQFLAPADVFDGLAA